MSETNQPNQAMIDYWNGIAGEKWTRLQSTLDQMLVPPAEILQAQAGELAGQRVLDIGCGTGGTCLRWLAAGAEVTGVDISAPMLALARERTAGKALLIEADAARWQSESPFDLAVSRFGVMFFDDPAAAFANIRTNLRPGGRLLFVCWRQLNDNLWASIPLAAVRDLMPPGPEPDPYAPGPFALADKERLHTLLSQAGFTDIRIAPRDYQACMAPQGGVEEAVRFSLQLGPAGAALAQADEQTKTVAAERLHTALAPYDQSGEVLLPAAVWLVEARRPEGND